MMQETTPTTEEMNRIRTILRETKRRLTEIDDRNNEPVAIVGAACRFPGGSNTLEEYWELIRSGVGAITEAPASKWDKETYYDPAGQEPGTMYSMHGGYIEDSDKFDPAIFSISPREAASIDPQHRILLEVTYEALENAAVDWKKLQGSDTGVYIGITNSEYSWLADPDKILRENDPHIVTGTSLNAAAGRISYVFGLQGPALSVDTACSSSLVSLHLACQSIRSGECGLAIAGGVNLILTPYGSIALCKAGLLSKTGECRAFDANANGMVRGEGCGVVVLKKLSKALRDGDNILGVIRGSSCNQDGASSGLTAPNGVAQESLLRNALKNSGVTPENVSYIEAHGTGTNIGDPIELGAIGSVYGFRERVTPLFVGTVKSNIGHLESAAGMAGFLKALLCVVHGEIPPQVNFTAANANIGWNNYRMDISREGSTWPLKEASRLAAVSSFGLTGTNAHMIIESPPARSNIATSQTSHLVVLSAPTSSALERHNNNINIFLKENAHENIPSIALSAGLGRRHYSHRIAKIVSPDGKFQQVFAGAPKSQEPHIRIELIKTDKAKSSLSKDMLDLSSAYKRTAEELEDTLGLDGQVETFISACSLLVALQDGGIKNFEIFGFMAGPLTDILILKKSPQLVLPEILKIITDSSKSGEIDLNIQVEGSAECLIVPLNITWDKYLLVLATYYTQGGNLNWGSLYGDKLPPRISLPNLPLERQSYWLPSHLLKDRWTGPAVQNNNFYEVAWHKHMAASGGPENMEKQSWLIIGSPDSNISKQLAKKLRQNGAEFYQLGYDSTEPEIEYWAKSLGGREAHVVILGEVKDGDTPQVAEKICFSVISILNFLGKTPARIILQTTGAQKVENALSQNALTGSAMWGLFRTIVQERPPTEWLLLDLDPKDSEGVAAERIITGWRQRGREHQLAWRGSALYAARLVRASVSVQDAMKIDADGTYLVTGGLGALGQIVTRDLVEQGARHLVLVVRNKVSAVAMEFLQEMKVKGATIDVTLADVSVEHELETVLDSIRSKNLPLRGVVHAAGVIDDILYSSMTAQHMQKVFAPKVQGSWNLHRLTEQDDLDFFVFFSTTGAILGNPGQAHYTAANAGMDYIASLRRERNLPSITINWGPWIGLGMARSLRAETLRKRGIEGFSVEEGIHTFKTALSANMAHVMALKIDWKSLVMDALAFPEFLEEMIKPEVSMLSKNAEEDIDLYLIKVLGKILNIEPERLESNTNIFEFGFDSLMEIEFISEIQKDTGLILHPGIVSQNPTILALSQYMNAQKKPVGAIEVIQSIPARDMNFVYPPLSFTQRRLWFLQQIEENLAAYNIIFPLQIEGDFDRGPLKKAINEIIRRHEILRTSFPVREGVPYQEIQSKELSDIHFYECDIADDMDIVHKWIEKESLRPFDLENGPMMRFSLLRTSPSKTIFVACVHHIIFDGRSLDIFSAELSHLWGKYAVGKEPIGIGKTPVQYADYACFQNDQDKQGYFKNGQDYWEEKLKDAPQVLVLPMDHARPVRQTYRGSTVELPIPSHFVSILRQYANSTNTTLSSILITAFSILLSRYSGQNDILIGTAVANRPEECKEAIGFYANTVIVRADLTGDPSGLDVLTRISGALSSALKYGDYPFEKLVSSLVQTRDLSRHPLFQAMFIHAQSKMIDINLSGVSISPLSLPSVSSKVDISLIMREFESDFSLEIEYNSDIFEQSTAMRMAGHLKIILESLVTYSDQPVVRYPMLSYEERLHILQAWQGKNVSLAPDFIHSRIEALAKHDPSRIALTAPDGEIDYGTLNERSNQIAHQLISMGVKKGDHVAIALSRSLDLIASLIASLKIGAAYVPLDPDYPLDRLIYMLNDSQSVLLITHSNEKNSLLKEEISCPVLVIDLLSKKSDMQSYKNPDCDVAQDDKAYVIYTSGSTGQPKGVIVRHDSLLNLVDSIIETPGLHSQDVMFAVTTICFDISGLEIFATLAAGARIHLVAETTIRDVKALIREFDISGATIIQATPALLGIMIDMGWVAGKRSIKILCGGEALSPKLAEKLIIRGAVWNMYGPTETTIWSSVESVTKGSAYNNAPAWPIGLPIRNTQFYVLDNNLQVLPVGIPGQLYIAGSGLAPGYFNRSNLTSERFMKIPEIDPLKIFYKTGDLVKRLPDGRLDFLGRLDHQIKLHGYRIELDEISAVAKTFEGIQGAVAILVDVMPLGEHIRLFIMAEHKVDSIQLRNFLKEKLPAYMIPAKILQIPKIPLTQNGKIDREALRAFEVAPTQGVKKWDIKSTTEKKIYAAFQEILGISEISISSNFFEDGGDSLMAVRLSARLRDQGIQVSVHDVLQNPIVGDLVNIADKVQIPSLVIKKYPEFYNVPDRVKEKFIMEGAMNAFPLNFVQQSILLDCKIHKKENIYVEHLSFNLAGKVDIERLHHAMVQVFLKHEALRSTIRHEGRDGPYQVVWKGDKIDLHVHDLRKESQGTRLILMSEYVKNSLNSINIEVGPLFKPVIFKLDDYTASVHIIFHHIILDGWSLDLVLRDLLSFYESNEIPMRDEWEFHDVLHWMNENYETDQDWWKEYLTGSTYPAIKQSLPKTIGKAESLSFSESLDKTQTEKIEEYCKRASITLNAFLQAAWVRVLADFTGGNEIVYGSTVSGRQTNFPGLLTIAGLLINTLPVRVKVTETDTIEDIAKNIFYLLPELEKRSLSPSHLIKKWAGIRPQASLFESIVVFEPLSAKALSLPKGSNLSISEVSFEEILPYPFVLTLTPGRELRITLSINPAPANTEDFCLIFKNYLDEIKKI